MLERTGQPSGCPVLISFVPQHGTLNAICFTCAMLTTSATAVPLPGAPDRKTRHT